MRRGEAARTSWREARRQSLGRSSARMLRTRLRPSCACSSMLSLGSISPRAMLFRKRAVASPVSVTMPAQAVSSGMSLVGLDSFPLETTYAGCHLRIHAQVAERQSTWRERKAQTQRICEAGSVRMN